MYGNMHEMARQCSIVHNNDIFLISVRLVAKQSNCYSRGMYKISKHFAVYLINNPQLILIKFVDN